MEMAKSIALALVLSVFVGVAGGVIVGESGARWRIDLADRQSAARAARAEAEEQARRAEEERLTEARRLEEEQREAALAAQRQAVAAYDPMATQAGVVNPMAGLQSQAPVASQPTLTASSEDYGGLPIDDGVEITFYLCGACHSLQLVTQQRLTPQRWDHLMDWMVAEQGMPEQTPEDRAAILGYLVRNFAP